MENPNNRPKKAAVTVRIGKELLARINTIAVRNGRTENQQLVVCAELGCHFDAMTTRDSPHGDLLNALFSAITAGGRVNPAELHSLIDTYFAKVQA